MTPSLSDTLEPPRIAAPVPARPVDRQLLQHRGLRERQVTGKVRQLLRDLVKPRPACDARRQSPSKIEKLGIPTDHGQPDLVGQRGPFISLLEVSRASKPTFSSIATPPGAS